MKEVKASGITKIQQPSGKCYVSAGLPMDISRYLDAEKGDDMAWLGLPIGTEEDKQPIAIAFIVDKELNVEEQARRVLKLISNT